MNEINSGEIAAVVLAGGRSQRMRGRDKLQLPFGEHTLLEHTLASLQTQCEFIVVNSNRHLEGVDLSGLPVVADKAHGTAGPLDGLISTMEWLLANNPEYHWLLSAPGDCPFLPGDLLARLRTALQQQDAQIAVASSAGRLHYGCALWSLELVQTGRKCIQEGSRALHHFIGCCKSVEVAFTSGELDPFYNVNTPEDYEHALALFAASHLHTSQ